MQLGLQTGLAGIAFCLVIFASGTFNDPVGVLLFFLAAAASVYSLVICAVEYQKIK